MARKLEVVYQKSVIGYSQRQRRTIEALGLRRLQQKVRLPDNESVRGMIHTVNHLVAWREVEESETA